MDSQYANTNWLGQTMQKKGLKISYSDIQRQIWLKFSIANSIYTHLKLKINPTQHDFLTMNNNSPQLNMSVNICRL